MTKAQKKVRGMRGSAAKEETPPEMAMMPSRVRQARDARNWRQEDLAAAAGVSQSNVSNMETAASLAGVRLVSVVRVAKALGFSLDEMILGVPNLYNHLAAAVQKGLVNPAALVPSDQTEPRAPAQGSVPEPRPQKTPARRRR